jgi:4-aminobutyrate aminotransferase-like enzyme
MFASNYKGVISDMLVLDKGLTGRYLPIAITFISEELSWTFDGLVSGVGRKRMVIATPEMHLACADKASRDNSGRKNAEKATA